MSEESTADTEQTTGAAAVQAPSEAVAAVKNFTKDAQGAKAVLQPIGAAGVRITLVADDNGILGDFVVATLAEAQAVVDAVDGVEIGEWDRELTSKADVSTDHYRKMAGWVANQKRFPKARNSAII